MILQQDPSQGIYGTGHNSILQVPGTDDWYMVYHRSGMPGGDGTHRETTIDKLEFNADGTIKPVVPTLTSVAPEKVPVDMQRLLDESEVQRAVTEPPADTRAYFRGRCLAKYSDSVAAASWDSVIFDIPGYDSLQRVPTMEPQRGTREHVGELLDRCETAADLVAALTGKR